MKSRQRLTLDRIVSPRSPTSSAQLLNYEAVASAKSPYPSARLKLSHFQINKWISSKLKEENVDSEDSEHDILAEEEEPGASRETLSLKTPFTTGKQAMFEFYKKYKSLNTNVAQESRKLGSASYRYLQQVDRMKRIPHPMGIVKWRGNMSELNLQSYKMGDQYAEALSEGLPYMSPEVVNLADNRLTRVGSEAVLRKLKDSVRHLNMSQNRLDLESVKVLGSFVKDGGKNLKVLNLEGTRLGDVGVANLCKTLADHTSLMEVNLARNQLTDSSCESLATVIAEAYRLSSLILHWNLITGEGASKLLRASIVNDGIKVMDLSWNSIGTVKGKLFAYTLADVLSISIELLHLDISNNKIKTEDCHTIAVALSTNQTLWGIHVLGNEASIDSKGFMHAGAKVYSETSFGTEHLASRINGTKMVVHNTEREGARLKRIHNCWICEGWSEVLFEWPFDRNSAEPVYLLLECDEYAPDLMQLDPETNQYVLNRMLPPGCTRFFFITEGKQMVSTKYRTAPYRLQRAIKFDDEMFPVVEVALESTNCIDIRPNKSLFKGSYAVTAKSCVPRPVPGLFIRAKAKKGRRPWSIPISLFKDYVVDSEALMNRCFEEDWRRMGKPKMPEESLVRCKIILKKNYRILKETFKYYSSIGRTESLFSINKLTLTDFIAHKVFLYDGDKLNDMDLSYMTIKGRPKVGKYQPKTALVRFEFMELLFRLALKKYFETKECRSEADAVEATIKKHMLPNCAQFNCQVFRDTRYWNEECDNILKSHFSLFESLYDSNSGSRKLPGEKNFMAYDEFLGIMSSTGLITEEFAEREVIAAYAMSMMTQVDETDKDRHMKMEKVEFYEAIARVAEGLSLPPPDSVPEDWPARKREEQDLACKMDQMIPSLLAACKKDFRERFRKPDRDLNTGLYFVYPSKRLSGIFKAIN